MKRLRDNDEIENTKKETITKLEKENAYQKVNVEKKNNETLSNDKTIYSKFLNNFFPSEFVPKIQFDSEDALSYLTPHVNSYEIAKFIFLFANFYSKKKIYHIIDGTAGLVNLLFF
jgi:hypothetical protein